MGIVIDVKLVQPEKVLLLIEVMLSGIVTDVNFVQLSKVKAPIAVTLYTVPLLDTVSGMITSPE